MNGHATGGVKLLERITFQIKISKNRDMASYYTLENTNENFLGLIPVHLMCLLIK